ncbi:hypothetical protein BDQ17DRAFT_1539256 [Cyathus striatus]|nr:hypothetical protein BDQ17DRAFT_1539256 [Cyathus striatus]
MSQSNSGPSRIPLTTPENPRTLSQILQPSQPLFTPENQHNNVPSTPQSGTGCSYSQHTPATPATWEEHNKRTRIAFPLHSPTATRLQSSQLDLDDMDLASDKDLISQPRRLFAPHSQSSEDLFMGFSSPPLPPQSHAPSPSPMPLSYLSHAPSPQLPAQLPDPLPTPLPAQLPDPSPTPLPVPLPDLLPNPLPDLLPDPVPAPLPAPLPPIAPQQRFRRGHVVGSVAREIHPFDPN